MTSIKPLDSQKTVEKTYIVSYKTKIVRLVFCWSVQ